MGLGIAALPAAAATLEQAERELARHNYPAAVSALQGLVENGDTQAQVRLGAMYQKGEGVARDPAKALALYTAAAQRGNADALYNLGNLYLMGEGVKQDDGWALTYYRQAAAQGHALAQKNMEQLYRAAGIDPPGANPAAPEAAAANPPVPEASAPPAATEAATATARPTYTDDELKAIQLARSHGIRIDLSKVAGGAAGDDAAGVIAESQEEGAAFGIDVSEEDATAPAAPPSLDAVKAQLARGDAPEAVMQLGALAAAGNGEAQLMMAERLADKRKPEYDESRSLQWLQRAAGSGQPEAEFRLAEKYFRGQGVSADEATAITLYRAAAAAGHAGARERLKGIYREAGIQTPPPAATPGGGTAPEGAPARPQPATSGRPGARS
ncbi:MAG: sel1 repeat family protein [Gammaproteobacteria bacterium]|nr:sel1 repeat family protein [Gammaproteobacteria bacterium]MBI5616423.1 sel1 repeat family protein [Gammaproteobacteria bacterium]